MYNRLLAAASTVPAATLASFDRLRAHPATFVRFLQAELAKDTALPSRGLTFYTPSLAFSVLDPLGHQRHRSRPRDTCLG